MIPSGLGHASDDKQTSVYETDPDIMNGKEIVEDRLTPEKSPFWTSSIDEDSINHGDGFKSNVNKEIPSFDEDSVDLSSPDSPASTRMTDSGEELTDDDTQHHAEQPFDDVPEGAVYSRISNHQSNKQQVDAHFQIYGRRELHKNKEIHHHIESFVQHLSIAKEKVIKFIKKFHDKKLMACFIFVIILAIGCSLVPFVNESTPKSLLYYLREEMYNLYPTQDKQDLRNLFHVISDVNQGKQERDKVAVITILYSHRETAECFAKTTANYAVKVLNRNKDFVQLNGSLSNTDFCLGNEDFKKDIEDKGVLVVYDFHNFPAEKVRYFHGICDKHTPFVEDKAVYIILLEMSQNQVKVSKKLEKVQSRMEELWSSLRSEILNPLGTRLMDNVMVVRQEPKLLGC